MSGESSQENPPWVPRAARKIYISSKMGKPKRLRLLSSTF